VVDVESSSLAGCLVAGAAVWERNASVKNFSVGGRLACGANECCKEG
jgi:hypothetical protein